MITKHLNSMYIRSYRLLRSVYKCLISFSPQCRKMICNTITDSLYSRRSPIAIDIQDKMDDSSCGYIVCDKTVIVCCFFVIDFAAIDPRILHFYCTLIVICVCQERILQTITNLSYNSIIRPPSA